MTRRVVVTTLLTRLVARHVYLRSMMRRVVVMTLVTRLVAMHSLLGRLLDTCTYIQ